MFYFFVGVGVILASIVTRYICATIYNRTENYKVEDKCYKIYRIAFISLIGGILVSIASIIFWKKASNINMHDIAGTILIFTTVIGGVAVGIKDLMRLMDKIVYWVTMFLLTAVFALGLCLCIFG